MGYESRIFVGRLVTIGNEDDENAYKFVDVMARMNLCKVSYDANFPAIFKTELPCELLGDVCNKCGEEIDLTTDCYGDKCRYTDAQTVIDFMEREEAKEHYRRFTPAIAMLKAYAAEKWEGELIVIHYGY